MSRKVVPLLALALVAGCGGGSAKQAAGTPGSSATGSTSGAPTASAGPSPTGGASTAPTPGGSTPGAGAGSSSTPGSGTGSGGTGTGGSAPAPGPVVPSAAHGVYSGVGDGVVTVSRSLTGDTALAHVVGRAAQALHVEASNVGGTTVLVDTSAAYDGVRAFNYSGGDTTLSVRASGPWSITITPASAARRFTGSVRGTGDDVVLYAGAGTQARITGGAAGRHFRVDANDDRLVDTDGPYRRLLPVSLSDGKLLFEVQASGPWSIAMS